MKNLFKNAFDTFQGLLLGKHPFNTVFSYNWIYVRSIIKCFKDNIELFKENVVIDYGSGNSPYFILIKDYIKEYYALDFYDNPIKKDKLIQISLKSDGSISNTLNNKADVIISNQVIEEVDDHKLYFDEINKISKIGTKLILTTPFTQALGLNDKFRVSPYYINEHLNRIGYEIIDYKTAGYLFTGMALSFNMCMILKNEYDFKTGQVEYSVIKSIIFAPFVALINMVGTLLDKIFPFYRMPSNFLIIAEKRKQL